MELINYPIMALSACVIAVTIIRVAQLPPGRIRLWEFNRQAGGFILVGLTSMVYSVHRVLNDMWPFKNAGTVSFHVLMITVGASIELVLHTLRSPTVDERAITRIVRRCLLLMTLLIITWLYGFSSEVVDELITLRHVPMAQLYGVSFHAYMVWMLGSVVVTFTGQTMATWRRRPIKAASYLSVAIGCACFGVVNIIFLSTWIYPWDADADYLWVWSAVYFAFIVAGLVLMGIGEPIADELRSLWKLRTLNAVWRKLTEASGAGLEAPRMWSAQVQLQRAYAEIADSLASLSPTVDVAPTPDAVARAILTGAVEKAELSRPARPTFAEILPPRASRTEDLQAMEQIARAYRRLSHSSTPTRQSVTTPTRRRRPAQSHTDVCRAGRIESDPQHRRQRPPTRG